VKKGIFTTYNKYEEIIWIHYTGDCKSS